MPAYWHVIRFLDYPLLPINVGPDVPKIVKHGKREISFVRTSGTNLGFTGISDDGRMQPKAQMVTSFLRTIWAFSALKTRGLTIATQEVICLLVEGSILLILHSVTAFLE